MRRLLAALLIYLALGPLPGSALHYAVDRVSQQVTARPLVFAPERSGSLRFVRGWRLVSPHTRFGGFSSIARLGPGRFQLFGDNGYWTRLTLRRGGRVAATIGELPLPAGFPAGKRFRDVEAMRFDPQSGKSWVALEGINQIWRLDPALSRVESRRRSRALFRWPANRGPESIVQLADGRTVLFSEDAATARGREALIYRDDPAVPGAAPTRFFYDAEGKGLVSDAAPLPDGRILLVHRRLGLAPLFTTILAIVDPADIRPGAVVRSRAIGRVPRALSENYEGAAVSVENGRSWLWLVSDDNFNGWQRSLLLQVELVDLPPPRAADSKKAAP